MTKPVRHMLVPRIPSRVSYCGLRGMDFKVAGNPGQATCDKCIEVRHRNGTANLKSARKDRRYIGGTL